ncbi:MAG: cysteine dioxygenase, partial [Mycobacteriaceae bacterium]|nr:cysteine dioxygenase [Mycobacteriaceae bacterium]
DQAAFPLGWVHDVAWAPLEPHVARESQHPSESGPSRTPTLSVHAYSPPLTAMSYYEITERDTLRRVRTELTETPEGK